ncbi:MAG: hypothetical protein LUO97_01410 [Methanomicrobiales archaeon]|nr:hypothetical protein [Methanomicrobiales archaeon]MDD1668436.1 hypothetical protein [Methanomicrobiales archaeon]
MPEGMFEETWFILPWTVVAAAGALLLAAGISLVIWSDLFVDLFILVLGLVAILAGIAILAGGHLMGRAGFPSIFLLAAGLFSLLVGLLVILWRDLAFDLIIFSGAAMGMLAGLFLLFLGSILSLSGWIRGVILIGGGGFFLTGIALVLFPALVAHILIVAAGLLLAGTGCLAISLALSMRAPATGPA